MKVKVGDQEVVLESKYLQVDESNMNDFLKEFAPVYSYYNQQWSKSQLIQYNAEDRYDTAYNEKFKWYKENEGGSDKLAEAKAKSHEDVVKAKSASRTAKYITQLLFTYLRSLDKAHENALNLGYNMRKEMDKIFPQHVSGISADVDAQVAKLLTEEGSKDA